jgi:predicted nucleic acid-binding Zn ribbon protein
VTAKRYRLPDSLAREVRDELERLGPQAARSPAMADLLAAWPAAVGPVIAANAWPARRTRDGTLVVHAASSVWAHELTQLEPTISERLGGLGGDRIRFVVGPLPEPGDGSVPSVRQLPDPPTALERSRAREMARDIEAEALREAVARAAALSLARSRSAGPDRPV